MKQAEKQDKQKTEAGKTDLLVIPGVGKNMKQHLVSLGYDCVEALVGADPEEIYQKDCIMKNCRVDRCALYVYRLAVYFAETPSPEPEKLKWWNWQDKK